MDFWIETVVKNVSFLKFVKIIATQNGKNYQINEIQ
jgi:hypothetical protein